MIITIPKPDLLRAVARCQGVSDKRSALPALSCVLIEVVEAGDDGAASLTATDLFSSIRVDVTCAADEVGSFAVDARDLGARLKHMPEGMVRLTYTESRLVLSAPGTPRKFTMAALPGADFPRVNVEPADGIVRSLTMGAAAFARAIDAVIYAVSEDETRAHVNSGLLAIGTDGVSLVATDGHRLSKFSCDPEPTSDSPIALVPLRALRELRKLLADGGNVAMRSDGTVLFLEVGTAVLFSTKLVDAQFPPYGQVIPKPNAARRVVAPRAAVMSAIDAVAVAAKRDTGSVRLVLSAGAIGFRAESSTGGDAVDDVPAECSIDLEVGINGRYLADVLATIDEDEVSLEFGGDVDPIRIDAPGLVAVIMPTRL